MVEIAKKVFEAENITLDYQLTPWTRAIKSTEKGEFDCILGAYKEDAPNFIFPKEAWGMDGIQAFVKKGDSWRYSDVNSIKKRKTGLIQDYSYGENLDPLFKANPDIVDIMSGDDALEKNIKKLLSGRIDTLLENKNVMDIKLQAMNLTGSVEFAGEISKIKPLYIACSPANVARSQKLLSIVDKQTKTLRASGELEAILGKYGLHDWQKQQ